MIYMYTYLYKWIQDSFSVALSLLCEASLAQGQTWSGTINLTQLIKVT
jgi:hypothetical protein